MKKVITILMLLSLTSCAHKRLAIGASPPIQGFVGYCTQFIHTYDPGKAESVNGWVVTAKPDGCTWPVNNGESAWNLSN